MTRRTAIPLVIALALLVVIGCGDLLGVDFGSVHGAAADSGALDVDGAVQGTSCATCATLGATCGTHDDGCGNVLDCGTCPNGQTCTGGTCKCTPRTCADLGVACGTQNDGCGNALDCGKCSGAGEACVNGKCACQPKSCSAAGASCGYVSNGCGDTLSCGTCADAGAGPYCKAGVCGATPCTPITTCPAGACGAISDGCGGQLQCGSCTPPKTCGANGTPNTCSCVPTTCAQQGKNCGSIPDGCGGTIACGSCTAPQTCGAAGTPNVCSCVPKTCAQLGVSCGAPADGCGGTLNCGSCATGSVCVSGSCCVVDPSSCSNCCGTGKNNCGLTCTDRSCCPTCFAAGMRVTMADGSRRAIETIAVGDMVASWDAASRSVVPARVTQVIAHRADESTGKLVVIDGVLRVTPNHPFSIEGRPVRADELRVGDPVTRPDGRVEHIRSIETVNESVPTWDLVVDGHGNYFVEGYIVFIKA